MRRIKYIVIIVLLCALAYLSFRIYASKKSNGEINRTLTSPRYQDMLANFNKTEIDSTTIIFIGNSLTEGFDLTQLNNPHVINMGINGDFTAGVMSRLDHIIKMHPKKLFIEIGVNDIMAKVPQETMYSNYETILKEVTENTPLTKVYVHSLLPTCRHESFVTSEASINERIVEFNALLVKLSEKYHCTYIDTWSHFAMKDNSMNPELTTDGVHLKQEGYKVWVDVIKDMVN